MINPYDIKQLIEDNGVEVAIEYLQKKDPSRRTALQYLRAWSHLWPDVTIPAE